MRRNFLGIFRTGASWMIRCWQKKRSPVGVCWKKLRCWKKNFSLGESLREWEALIEDLEEQSLDHCLKG